MAVNDHVEQAERRLAACLRGDNAAAADMAAIALADELAATADGEPRALLAAAWLHRRHAELPLAGPDRDQVERQADELTI